MTDYFRRPHFVQRRSHKEITNNKNRYEAAHKSTAFDFLVSFSAAEDEKPKVVRGSVSFEGLNTENLKIVPKSQLAIINWHGPVNLQELEILSPPGATTLHRVLSGQTTVISSEALKSKNGQIMVIDQNGIIVGPSGGIKLRS
ncbi:MAG: hypothetical protein P1V20_31135, partial [Verrucomicrobiales bacterium]|nr:hypothetical protein [Verrucomicrobiales bacterium]